MRGQFFPSLIIDPLRILKVGVMGIIRSLPPPSLIIDPLRILKEAWRDGGLCYTLPFIDYRSVEDTESDLGQIGPDRDGGPSLIIDPLRILKAGQAEHLPDLHGIPSLIIDPLRILKVWTDSTPAWRKNPFIDYRSVEDTESWYPNFSTRSTISLH